MKTIAYLTSSDMVPGHAGGRDDLYELELQLAALVPACAAHGLELQLRVWDDPATGEEVAAGRYGAVVVGTTWDYHSRADAFLAAVDRFDSASTVLNPPAVLRWNAHKSYLRALPAAGVPVVPTAWVDAVTVETVTAAFQRFGGARLVAKPVVGAGADRQVRLERGAPLPPVGQGPPGAAMLQPYLPSIEQTGELSLLYFGGVFSHGVQKRPRVGDYRVQSVFGGREEAVEVGAEARAAAEKALGAVPGGRRLLQARVDLVEGLDGRLQVIELELIEPYLYPEQGPGMGPAWAAALVELLAGGRARRST